MVPTENTVCVGECTRVSVCVAAERALKFSAIDDGISLPEKKGAAIRGCQDGE